jgi:hypothetical protein
MQSLARRRAIDVASAILAVAGLGCILAGWWGLHDKATVVEQLPYLASGGIGGLAAVIGAAALVHLSRQFRIEKEIARLARRQEDLEESFDRLVAALNGKLETGVGRAPEAGRRRSYRPAGVAKLHELSDADGS